MVLAMAEDDINRGSWQGLYWTFTCCELEQSGQMDDWEKVWCLDCGKLWIRPEGEPEDPMCPRCKEKQPEHGVCDKCREELFWRRVDERINRVDTPQLSINFKDNEKKE